MDEQDVWAIVELMGHVKLAGRLTEEEKFGAKMGRLDIPTHEKCECPNASRTNVMEQTVECSKCDGSGFVKSFVSQYFGGGSVYRITIVTEEVARHVNRQTSPAPVSPWDFPKQLTSTPQVKVDTWEGMPDRDDFEE
jgi:hypothetical protein